MGILSLDTWRIGDSAAKHRLLLAGLGWGGMPEPDVRADIAAGRLVHLDLPNWRGGEYPLAAIHNLDNPPGPAGRWLIGHLATLSDAAEGPPG
jgi:DNA-binding transcriptional LysR family regulator